MKLLVLGANGMAGHIICLYLKEQGFDVVGLARKRGMLDISYVIGDVRDTSFIEGLLIAGEYDAVINCVGILNQKAEIDIESAIYVNAMLPHILARITRNIKTKCIHLSTDCVFSGKDGGYVEQSVPDGMGAYSHTKILGELIDNINLTFRTSIVGPELKKDGIGLMHWFMQQKGSVYGYEYAYWTGVTTLTLAKAIVEGLRQNVSGLYHLVNNKKISKYELLNLFNSYIKKEKVEIIKSDKVKHDKSLICTRKDFNFIVPDYEGMINEINIWMKAHKSLYLDYEVTSFE